MEGRLAEASLERYGLRGAHLEPLSRRFVQVFRVVSGRDRFTLRLYDLPQLNERSAGSGAALRTGPGLRSRKVLRSQLRWLSDLALQGDLLVPEPTPLPDGSLLGRISTRELDPRGSRLRWASRRRDAEELQRDIGDAPVMRRNFVLHRWVPGERKEHPGPEDLAEAGSYVARLHRHAEGYEIPEDTTLPRWNWEWTFGESANLWNEGTAYFSESDMDGFRTAARHVREELLRLEKGRKVFGVIHRDLKLENLLFGDAGVGAVDFDLCGLGYFLFDLWVMRDSLKTHHENHFEPLWAAFLAGYEDKRPLPENLPTHLKTFEAMQKMAMVNRQIRLLSKGTSPAGLRSPHFLANVANWFRDLPSE